LGGPIRLWGKEAANASYGCNLGHEFFVMNRREAAQFS
jgi:hypothetical protein